MGCPDFLLADIVSPEKRSWIMSQIRGKNTKIEIRMERVLKKTRLKFEKHPKMYANPDFVNRRKKIIIFCDGDFWHGYKYDTKKKPAKKFWRDKIEGNMRRDKRYTRKLRREGWSVLRFWEHDIDKNPEKCLRRVDRKIKSQKH
jgi:DNA mismatch endonuclease, patch repair protein